MPVSFKRPIFALLGLAALALSVVGGWLWFVPPSVPALPAAGMAVLPAAPAPVAPPIAVLTPAPMTEREIARSASPDESAPRSARVPQAAQTSASIPPSFIKTDAPRSVSPHRAGTTLESAVEAPRAPTPAAIAESAARRAREVAALSQPPLLGAPRGAAPAPVEAPTGALPVAWVPPPADLPLDEAQATALEKMRQDFVDAVGGVNQDPTDPDYADRWALAAAESNRRYQTIFGQQAFLIHERQANLPQ